MRTFGVTGLLFGVAVGRALMVMLPRAQADRTFDGLVMVLLAISGFLTARQFFALRYHKRLLEEDRREFFVGVREQLETIWPGEVEKIEARMKMYRDMWPKL